MLASLQTHTKSGIILSYLSPVYVTSCRHVHFFEMCEGAKLGW